MLRGSYRVVLALDDERVVGFVASLSDGVLYAHLSLLEVLLEYRGQRNSFASSGVAFTRIRPP